jgi:antitoxin Phd
MSRVWQLQEAKNKFSEVVDEALRNGPQVITRRGVETVVIVSYGEYRKARGMRTKLSRFFKASPLADTDIDLARDQSGPRGDTGL